MTDKNSCFAYAETCYGTVNYFDNIFDSQNLDKLYIIKGCIDSSFLNEISRIAADKKYTVEYFIDPIDFNNLNGIIIKEIKTAVIYDYFNISKYPVIIENILNFGNMYDELKLNNRKKEILEFAAKKCEYMNLSYKFLKAANELCENTIELSNQYIDHEKLDFSINRLINKYINDKTKNNRINEYKFINSVSSSGYVELDVFENEAKKIFYISNENFLGWHYMKIISNQFSRMCKVICPDALNPKRIRAIYLKDSKTFFVIKNKILNKNYNEKYHFINMERFVRLQFKKENKQKLKFIQKCYQSIMDETVKYLNEAESINKNIKNIYLSAIKPDVKNKFTEEFIQKILP